jgi:hypothetical protein
MPDVVGSDFDPFSLEAFRSSIIGDVIVSRRPPPHQPGYPFIKGPIPFDWIASACRLPGIGLHIAMAYRLHRKRFTFSHGRHWGIGDSAEGLHVSNHTVRRGFHAAERAGLISAIRRPGCKPRVTILDLPTSGPEYPPLHGPIPWAWWLPASRLQGKSLQVAAVCWLLAGWGRSADIELSTDLWPGFTNWAEFGLSQSSAFRGLNALESAGLVSVVRRPGRTSIVSILGPNVSIAPVLEKTMRPSLEVPS